MGKKQGSFTDKLRVKEAKDYLDSLKLEGVDNNGAGFALDGVIENLRFEMKQHAVNVARYRVMRKLNDPPEQLNRQRDAVAKSLARVEAFRDEYMGVRDYLIAQTKQSIPVPPEVVEKPAPE